MITCYVPYVTEFTVEDFGLVKMVIYHIVKAPTVLEANNGE